MSRSHQRLIVAALLLLPAFSVGLHVLGFSRFNRLLTRVPARGKPQLTLEKITAIGSLVNSAAFHSLGPDSCLPRSLYLLWLLRRQGIMCDLRIGMQLSEGQLRGHAWVEVAGQPVNDPRDVAARYTAFPPFSMQLFRSK